MTRILNLDTAFEWGYVSLAGNGSVLAERTAAGPRDHASFVHVAIGSILNELQLEPSDIDAVAVSAGPGSYTGLRIGFAAAKGLCHALNKPLICINTLELLAAEAQLQISGAAGISGDCLICPMIDARRMEVYTAVYNQCLNIEKAPCSEQVDAFFMQSYLDKAPVYFIGDGVAKFEKLSKSTRSYFGGVAHKLFIINELSYNYFRRSLLADWRIAEPYYLKSFTG